MADKSSNLISAKKLLEESERFDESLQQMIDDVAYMSELFVQISCFFSSNDSNTKAKFMGVSDKMNQINSRLKPILSHMGDTMIKYAKTSIDNEERLLSKMNVLTENLVESALILDDIDL